MSSPRLGALPESYPYHSFLAVLSYRAVKSPNEIAVRQPNYDSTAVVDYSYGQLMAAVNGISSWLEREVGLEACQANPIAYIGLPDVRYCLFPLGIQKIGGVSQNLSLGNSPIGSGLLMQSTGCQTLVYSGTRALDLIPSDAPVRRLEIPDVEELIKMGDGPLTIIEDPKYENALVAILQSSGTTGHPKALRVNQGALARVATSMHLPDVKGLAPMDRMLASRRLFFGAWPIFQSSGFMGCLVQALYAGTTILLTPMGRRPDAELLLEMVDRFGVDAAAVSTSMFQELWDLMQTPRRERVREQVMALDHLRTAGAMMPREACEGLFKLTQIRLLYASTETYSTLVMYHKERAEDWEWLHLPPQYNSSRWEPNGEGLYELVIVRDPHLENLQGVFKNYPDRSEFRTNDLFERHPTEPDYYRCVGRADDTIAFSSGLKIHPSVVESIMNATEGVSRAMLVGKTRPTASLIIHPEQFPSTEKDREELMQRIWSRVELSNATVSAAGRIPNRSHILLTTPEKPLPTTFKGDINRKEAVRVFEKEIESIYQ